MTQPRSSSPPAPPRQPYQTPRLEIHRYTVVTGASLPVSTNALPNPFKRDQQY
ncbi:hypothetical protein [Deinococcus soli (ex Cha et al. 2016)]|uniref:Uncharacterized protein n=2 Tax=Deinococcus soli (ex Cha et al. 2016) TaxID=1309411 RepID=A0AAE3XJS4_9DEIO|nr:hypothetical protein [Deinococcus soli (ex Cha et al. 2016)]MDR6220873.1 hypothetical protein [Deinococcus soli (ex Cha et al. 2016)]MDR6330867.1 hypothetical protein [Deinococcus soli (ex Cha et al. 2016)]MDR6753972.1 hypothetical protein [Deinococcus soli (ex Cha et al. 2016)]